MSHKQYEGNFEGLPMRYPEDISLLNSAVDFWEGMLNGLVLKKVGNSLLGFRQVLVRVISQEKNGTSYSWYCAVQLEVQELPVYVLLPWVRDWDKTDGSELDRSTAVVAQVAISDEILNNLLEKLAEAIKVRREEDLRIFAEHGIMAKRILR